MNLKLAKWTLGLTIILLSRIVNAQDESLANQVVVGGSLSFSTQNNTYPFSILSINSGIGGIFSSSTDQTKNTTFFITPYIGKELDQNWLLGLQFDYRVGYFKEEDVYYNFPIPSDTFDFIRNSNQIGIGIFSRYILNPENQFNFYLQPYAEYNILHEEEQQDAEVTQEENANFIELGIGGGVLYNINETWRATIGIGGLNYVSGSWEIEDTETGSNFSTFSTNLRFSNLLFGVEMKL